ncbi:MAG TPA: hypothetical protein VGJ93_09900 [Desulfuromonadaceae bacterium]|jgi:hypothetical protein
MRLNWRLLKSTVLLAVTALIFTACGSGGSAPQSTQSVSGVAAAGAPLIGKAWLKDKLGVVQGPVDIDDHGNFIFPDVSKLTAPFLIQADGAAGGLGYRLHSVATGAGTANVNPITNMIVAASAGGKDPATVFGSQTSGNLPDASIANINQASVEAAIAAIKQMLAPLLTQFSASDIDPLKGAYVADPTTNKLDAVFEAVKITVIPSTTSAAPTFTVNNKMTGVSIATGTTTTTNITSMTTTTAAIPAATITTEIQNISTMLTNWVTTLNKGAALTAADLESYYVGTSSSPAAYDYNNGRNRKNIIDDMVIGFTQKMTSLLPIIKASNFSLKGDVTANYTGMAKVYEISGMVTFASGNTGAPDGGLYVAQETAGGAWKFIGNRRKIDADIHPYAHKYFSPTSTTPSYESGQYIFLDDIGNIGYKSARVSGPGLPASGVTFSTAATNMQSATRMSIDPNQVTSINMGDTWSKYPLSDSVITSSIATPLTAGQKLEYTVELYTTASAGATGTSVHSFKIALNAPPVTLANLQSGSYFPTVTIANLTNGSIVSLAALFGTNMTYTITMPTSFTPSWATLNANIWSQMGGSDDWKKNIPLNVLTGTFLIPKPTSFTATNAQLSCELNDLAKREFRVLAQFQ